MKRQIPILSVIVLYSFFVGCKASGNFPGREYMPDMAHSKAYEPYSSNPNFEDGMSARLPVPGTVARGFIPYTVANTNDGYEQAGGTILSPFSYQEHAEVLEDGKYLYNIYCTVCHGEKGEADGTIVKNGKYPPPPSYFRADILELPEGKMFHSLTYGKNLMGSYASQLTQEERWKIVSYIKQVQAEHIAGKDGISEQDALARIFKGRGGAIDYVPAKINTEASAQPDAEVIKAQAVDAGLTALSSNATKGTKITLKNVLFNSGSAVLKRSSFSELNNLANILKSNEGLNIEVGGHTDNVGSVQLNRKLSDLRAKSVKDYLVKKGILSSRISSRGYGPSDPVAGNKTAAGRAKNRRTEVKVK